ncbi:hypothetical protein EJ02DRAFT_166599 [Clathrospora elynae]|uniref:Uncharacterized protein n=1 Tax=Clathrospora elynae TaxID=706981 RepID=A0A6A5SSI0_9PLEO|nr:hypothetical protein EJ02DRAFT_166599 [Clathrospora elynae]
MQDSDRPPHLPAHFVRTPYLFPAKKKFPKPVSRPRQRGIGGDVRLYSGYGDDTPHIEMETGMEGKELDDRKGKHVLGLVTSEGDYDLRSRLERNESAQGLVRSQRREGKDGGVVLCD